MNRRNNYKVGDLVRYRRNSYDKMSEWRASRRVGLIQDAPTFPDGSPRYAYSVLWSDLPIPETVTQCDLEIVYEEPG